jgi:hypothetical protein
LALSCPYSSDHMDYNAQFFFSIIPWIDNGRYVADIYEYADNDFMMKFFCCYYYRAVPVRSKREIM